ncbi:MAG: GTPase-associated system all-helical protein GASH, partial [Fimbriimonadales bacterium]
AALSKQLGQFSGPLAESLSQLTIALESQARQVGRSAASKASLLWWRESLYSPSLRRSYRRLSPTELAVCMAHDLNQLVSSPAPASVEFFLREALNAVLGDDPEIPLKKVLEETRKSERIGKIVRTTKLPVTQRLCLHEFLSVARGSTPAANTLAAWVGVGQQTKLWASDWAVWLFRDAQAQDLCAPPQNA